MIKEIMKLAAIGILFLSIGTSCNKTNKYPHLDLLVDKEWKLVSVQENGVEISTECDLDNSVLFGENEELVYNFGTINCDGDSEAQSWKFGDDFGVIKFKYKTRKKGTFGFGNIPWRIIVLNSSNLVLSETYASTSENKPQIRYYTN